MADVFERRRELNEPRSRLWNLIVSTPMLDWLLLTKRPQNIEGMTPWSNEWPENVWIGTTAENQHWADIRVPILAMIPAKVRFLSCEPLLDSIDLAKFQSAGHGSMPVDWVIAGGESGPNSRPMDPQWVCQLRDVCVDSGVAFHFKQWGHWVPEELLTEKQKKVIVLNGLRLAGVRKGVAGRTLDGRVWDEFPVTN